jgi:hypothetical protein
MVAVAKRILFKVILMTIMSWIERIQRRDNGSFDGSSIVSVFLKGSRIHQILKLLFHSRRNLVLFLVVTKNDGGILRPRVVSLSILGGRIMKLKEEANQLLKRFFITSVIGQFHVKNFHVPRRPAAHLFVRRIFHCLGVGRHESDSRLGNSARKRFLEVLDDELFRSPVAAYGTVKTVQYSKRNSWSEE